jgi:hypothetical protein
MDGGHAILSPSSAHRWVACPGSVVLEEGRPRSSSKYAAEGTAAHEVAAACLITGEDAAVHIGRVIDADGFTFEVTKDMADAIQSYLDTVRSVRAATGGKLLVEQALPIDHLTDEAGAAGTGDAVILTDGEIIVIDLKFGQGERVDAEGNLQMAMYALGAMKVFDLVGPFEKVRMMIVQPRIGHVSEWSIDWQELNIYRGEIVAGAVAVAEAKAPQTDLADFLQPGEKQCRWCKAKATCPALRRTVETMVTESASVDEFKDLTKSAVATVSNQPADFIALLMPHLDLVEDWVKAVRARAEELLHAGVDVPGYKLVRGKQGNRAWSDKDQAEAVLKSMRLKQDEMYSFTLISPTAAEKLLAKESPKRWAKLQPLITRSEGSITVAPVSDNRPAIEVKPVADDFTDLTADSSVDDIC